MIWAEPRSSYKKFRFAQRDSTQASIVFSLPLLSHRTQTSITFSFCNKTPGALNGSLKLGKLHVKL